MTSHICGPTAQNWRRRSRRSRRRNSKQASEKQANNAETVSEAKEEGKDIDSDEYFRGVTLEVHLATLSDGEDSGEDVVEEYDFLAHFTA